MTDPTSITDEIKAMQRLVVVLDKLEPDTRRRVLVWAWGVYKQEQAPKEEL